VTAIHSRRSHVAVVALAASRPAWTTQGQPAVAPPGEARRAQNEAVRPFTIQVPDAVLADLKVRLSNARLPEPLQGDGWAHGTDIRYPRELVDAPIATPASNLWIYPGPDHDANVARAAGDPEAPFPFVYVSWPSAKDPSFARRHDGRATVELITLAPYAWFSRWSDTRWKRRGADYDAFKAHSAARLLDVLCAHVPGPALRADSGALDTALYAPFRERGSG
jgi:hypothetical protein